MKNKKRVVAFIVIILLAAAGVLYHVYDNNRFVIVEQNVITDGLPEEFDGYRILQISGKKTSCHYRYWNKIATGFTDAKGRKQIGAKICQPCTAGSREAASI